MKVRAINGIHQRSVKTMDKEGLSETTVCYRDNRFRTEIEKLRFAKGVITFPEELVAVITRSLEQSIDNAFFVKSI